MKKLKYKLLTICSITIIILFINLVLIDWYEIPSNSMAPTLNLGAVVIISRGLKQNSIASKIMSINIKKKDIIVFIKPEWNKTIPDSKVYVKRCIGLPGDTVRLHHQRDQPNVSLIPGQQAVMYLFPQDTLFNCWTLTDYGPFIVPKKNQSLPLTEYNVRLYKTLIQFENETFEYKSGKVFIHGKVIAMYTFNHNYYFMIGDNFLQSEDSRYWGCVPDVSLLGKVIWHS